MADYIKNRLSFLKAQADVIMTNERGRELTYSEIGDVTGIAGSTLSKMARQKTSRYDEATIAKLVVFFQTIGVECSVGDFLTEGTDFPPLGLEQSGMDAARSSLAVM